MVSIKREREGRKESENVLLGKFREISLKYKITLPIMLLVMAMLAAVLITTSTNINNAIEASKAQISNEMTRDAVRGAEGNLELIADNMDSMLQSISTRVDTLRERNYLKNDTGEADIQGILDVSKASDERIQSIYFARHQGKFQTSPAQVGLPAGYNPKDAEWFTGAMGAGGEEYWTAPYEDADTGDLVMTVSQEIISDKGESQGVLGVDVSIESVQQMLNEFTTYEGSIMMIVDHEGVILYNNENPEREGQAIHNKDLLRVLQDRENPRYSLGFDEGGMRRVGSIRRS